MDIRALKTSGCMIPGKSSGLGSLGNKEFIFSEFVNSPGWGLLMMEFIVLTVSSTASRFLRLEKRLRARCLTLVVLLGLVRVVLAVVVEEVEVTGGEGALAGAAEPAPCKPVGGSWGMGFVVVVVAFASAGDTWLTSRPEFPSTTAAYGGGGLIGVWPSLSPVGVLTLVCS